MGNENLEKSLNDNLLLVLDEISSLQEKFDMVIEGQEGIDAELNANMPAIDPSLSTALNDSNLGGLMKNEQSSEQLNQEADVGQTRANRSVNQTLEAPERTIKAMDKEQQPLLEQADVEQMKSFSESAQSFMAQSQEQADVQKELGDSLGATEKALTEANDSVKASEQISDANMTITNPNNTQQENWNPDAWNKTAEMVLGAGATAAGDMQMNPRDTNNNSSEGYKSPTINASMQIKGGSSEEAKNQISNSVTNMVAAQI